MKLSTAFTSTPTPLNTPLLDGHGALFLPQKLVINLLSNLVHSPFQSFATLDRFRISTTLSPHQLVIRLPRTR